MGEEKREPTPLLVARQFLIAIEDVEGQKNPLVGSIVGRSIRPYMLSGGAAAKQVQAVSLGDSCLLGSAGNKQS